MGRTLFIRLWLLCAIVALSSWSRGEDDNMPMPPDYSDSTQWYISNRGSEADLFYIISTETSDYVRNGDTCHYADTYDRKLCRGMLKEMHAVDSMFSGNLNYYSPYYRQVTMQSWSNESLAIARLPIALDDVRRSWDYYIRYMNEGRPFIMAGFSALRLAKFNLDTRQSTSFIGLPTPANALFWGSLILGQHAFLVSAKFNALFLLLFMLISLSMLLYTN